MKQKLGVPDEEAPAGDLRRRRTLKIVALGSASAVLLSVGVTALTSASLVINVLAAAGTFGSIAAGAVYVVRPRGFAAWLLVFAVAGASAGLVSWLLDPTGSLAASVAEWVVLGIVLFLIDSWVLFL